MINNAFLHVARGARVEGYMNLKASAVEHPYKYGRDYTYVEIGLASIVDMDGDTVSSEKLIRNKSLILQSGYTINPVTNHKVLISVNPLLSRYANVSLLQLVDFVPDSAATRIEVPIQMRRDMKVEELTWLVRLYLMA